LVRDTSLPSDAAVADDEDDDADDDEVCNDEADAYGAMLK
jgi:hypothetical protein